MSEGYLYCFSNCSMPNILKIGMTERTPEARLADANTTDTWRPPTPYVIEFAKKVSNPVQKEKTLHVLLEQYTNRVNPRRVFFELMDGEMWKNVVNENDTEDKNADTECVQQNQGCRDMRQCFVDGQRIRHLIGINKELIGIYNASTNDIVCGTTSYQSLSGMAKAHNKNEFPHRLTFQANGWKECECEIDGKWMSTYSLSCSNEIL